MAVEPVAEEEPETVRIREEECAIEWEVNYKAWADFGAVAAGQTLITCAALRTLNQTKSPVSETALLDVAR